MKLFAISSLPWNPVTLSKHKVINFGNVFSNLSKVTFDIGNTLFPITTFRVELNKIFIVFFMEGVIGEVNFYYLKVLNLVIYLISDSLRH